MNTMMHGESEEKGKKMGKALNCQQTRHLLATRTSDQGPREDDPRLSDHLATCPACARLASDYGRDRARLGAHLHTADWSPVAARPWQEAQPPTKRSAAWGRLATGANWLAGFGLAAVVALTLALVLPVMVRGGGSGGAGAAPSPSPTAPTNGAACTSTIISVAPGDLLPTPPPFNGTPVAIPNGGTGSGLVLTPVPVAGGNQATTVCTPCAVTTAPAQGAATSTPTPASASASATVVPGSFTVSATCLPITSCAAVAAVPPVEMTPTPTPAGTTSSTGTTAPTDPTPVPLACTPGITSCVVTSIATPEGAEPATAPQGTPVMPTTVIITGGGECTAIPGVPSLPPMTPIPYDPTQPTPTIVPSQSATPTPTPAR